MDPVHDRTLPGQSRVDRPASLRREHQREDQSLSRPGPAPLYISADATNLDALEEAGRAILKAHPAIHGVVQSAIVLRDQSLADMEESEFRTSLSAKVDVSVNMDRVFGKLELDFMLFFSSILSFFKTPRQANYAAGCTFKDSFARKLQLERAYPVKVMNWGYWGSVGVVAHESYRQTMRQLGVGSIDPQEGMELLQAFVNCDLTQMAVIKTLSRDITAGLLVAQPDTKSDSLLRQARQKEQVANQSIHHLIVENLSEALKIEAAKISTDVPVMDYGVDSIIGVNLVRTINEALEIDLPLKALFGKTTVAELVEVITQVIAAKTEKRGVPAIPSVDRTKLDLLPLSFTQERVWFFEQLEPGSARYNMAKAVIIRGELDINQVEEAFNLIIARHESLRTVFPSQDGQARQVILDRLDFKLQRFDVRHGESQEGRDRQAQEICQEDAAKPFDLERGPLLRSLVIQRSEHEHILMINMHHIIGDGWSLGVLTRELGVIMEALRRGQSPQLEPLPIQYVDYAVWQRKRLEEGEILREQLEYWQRKLAGVAESLELTTDYPRPSTRSFTGATYGFSVDPQLAKQLKSLAERRGATLYMVLLAVFKVLLHRYTGQEDICVGTLIANRQYGETEGLIGMFANILALRSQVDGDERFFGLLSQIKATCLEAYEHQDAPFEKVVDTLHSRRKLATNPIFQVMLILQNAAMGMPDDRFLDYPVETGLTELDLGLEFTETAQGLAGSIEYSKALFRTETIGRMAEHFLALCGAIVAKPASR